MSRTTVWDFAGTEKIQWYIARIVDLLGAPGSILHDDLLDSAGYPSADEWARIDLKREELLKAALDRFASDNRDLVEALLDKLTTLIQRTEGDAPTTAPKLHDPFGYLNERVSVQRTQIGRRSRSPTASIREWSRNTSATHTSRSRCRPTRTSSRRCTTTQPRSSPG